MSASTLLERLDALGLSIYSQWSEDGHRVTACNGRLLIADHPDGRGRVTLAYEPPGETGMPDVALVGDLLQCIATIRRQLRDRERNGERCLRGDIVALSNRDTTHYWQRAA